MNINIRFAKPNDLSPCTELDLHKNSEFILNKIHRDEVLIAELDNKIIGCLKVEYIWSHLPFISYIEVKDNFRHEGIGKKLLSFLEDYLKEKNLTTLLSSTMVDAVNSQNWHVKNGFEKCGLITDINPGNIGEIFYKKSI